MLSRQHKMVLSKPSLNVLTKVTDMAALGKLQPAIGKKVPLSEAIPALIELEQHGTPKGKLVITRN